ncbi:Suppressor of fused protein (SUFU) [Streptomyces zhaozhouensis]|uniref:Suppressor of fused protein (SUFU) n=1 Tax=Streptomyces zhaozhouensis TaxID=1300267 RepID=A0A286DQT7_9ACTN|nr:suppressor of fused domain protein [Streptomyces zhaozhouensis]SOD61009.1 Suppressor of fused protein (SUFU) [Streptomyces zhaozhouensis]
MHTPRPVPVLDLVAERLRDTLGEPDARASVTFLGTERIEVLRFPAPGRGLVRYVTLGMSAAPMADPTAAVADPERGPRAELTLTLRAGLAPTDQALRALATFAATPQVEGVVVAPGGSLELGEPLWPGAAFRAVLVGEGGDPVPDLELPEPLSPVRFLPLLPMTPAEAAWKRARGAPALTERWTSAGTDLTSPTRSAVSLQG